MSPVSNAGLDGDWEMGLGRASQLMVCRCWSKIRLDAGGNGSACWTASSFNGAGGSAGPGESLAGSSARAAPIATKLAKAADRHHWANFTVDSSDQGGYEFAVFSRW